MIDIVLGPKLGLRVMAERHAQPARFVPRKGPETVSLKTRKRAYDALFQTLTSTHMLEAGEVGDLLALNSQQKVRNAKWKSLFWRSELPEGALWYAGTITKGMPQALRIWLPSPAFPLLLMMRDATPVLAYSLVCEACGHYFMHRATSSEQPSFRKHKPLTSREAIVYFAQKLPPRSHYRQRLETITKLGFDGARSPMETLASAIFTWPEHAGGFGFSRPELNYTIPLTRKEAVLAGQSYLEFDFYWPEKNVRVEYDSHAFHSEACAPHQVLRDQHRQNVAQARGVKSFALTPDILANPRRLCAFCESLARAISCETPALTQPFLKTLFDLVSVFRTCTDGWDATASEQKAQLGVHYPWFAKITGRASEIDPIAI